MFKRFDLKYTVWAAILIVGFALSYIFYNKILCCIKYFFCFPELNLCAGGIATIFTLLHKIKNRKITFNPDMSFKDFRASVGDIISFIDNPIILVGSLALAKGLFLQYTEGVVFFPFLKGYEVTFVLLVTLYLLYISLMELWSNIKGTCWDKPIIAEQPKATPQEQTKNKEVPKPEE